jgi:glycerol-3-phosphate acyltransferase PlsY
VTVLAAYLLGSIPTGFLVARGQGVDIRAVGSGNIGATNVFRYLGVPAGLLVLLADAAKGWVAVAVAAKLILVWVSPATAGQPHEWPGICAGCSAIVGHNYTCWLWFKGGKGIATTAGVLGALAPWSLLIIFGIWVVVLAVSRYVSLASIAAALGLPPAAWFTTRDPSLTAMTGLMTLLAVYKHRANIKRLLNGTETRLGRKPLPAPAPPAPLGPPGPSA